jgi:Holliday junction resolvasome RuvABC endonuclease subunit
MHVIGIDPSPRNTGIVVLRDRELVVNCTVSPPKLTDVNRIQTYTQTLERVLGAVLASYDGTPVAIEDYAYGQVNRAHHLGEYGGLLRFALSCHAVEWCEVNMGTARKLALGSARAAKGENIKVVTQQFWRAALPARGIDEHQADALTVANLLASELGLPCWVTAPAKKGKKRCPLKK